MGQIEKVYPEVLHEREPDYHNRRPVGRDLGSNITADIIPSEDNPENLFKKPCCDKLKKVLNKERSTELCFGKWDLDVTLYLMWVGNDIPIINPNSNNDCIRIWGTFGEANLLARLKTVLERYGLDIKLKVKIEQLHIPPRPLDEGAAPSSNVIDRLSSQDAKIELIRSSLDGFPRPTAREGIETLISSTGVCPGQRQGWYRPVNGSDGAGFGTCVLTVTAVLSLDNSNFLETCLFPVERAPLTTDPNIVITLAGKGEDKCHRAVLSASGSVFEAMFRAQLSSDPSSGRSPTAQWRTSPYFLSYPASFISFCFF